ncbi:MAG: ATP-binding protein [Chloroflexota bacterium]|nr:ATP-binding protein [Chloroflexota bacterium]
MTQLQSLPSEALCHHCDPKSLNFETTDDIPPLEKVLGQPRALRALELGSEVAGPGFNIFVAGLPDSGRTTLTSDYLERKAIDEPIPDDWCYVNNFDNPHSPKAINLPSGMATSLKDDIDALITRCKQEIQQAFASEGYTNERNHLAKAMQKAQEAELRKLETIAKESNFTISRTSSGFALIPVIKGKPITPEQLEKLSEEHQEKLTELREKLSQDAQTTIRGLQNIGETYYIKFKKLDEYTTIFAIDHLFKALKENFADYEKVTQHLEAIQNDIVENVDKFLGDKEESAAAPQWLSRYEVNVLVDNSELDGAPVIMESHPSYHNLIGRIEHRIVMGASQTNFTLIRSGALHRANGGYLLIPARDVLLNPYAWDGLERALRDGKIRIRELGSQLSLISTISLEPDPIPISVKVVLFGTPILYELLRQHDVDFAKLFKVRAEFATIMNRSEENAHDYALFIKSVVDDNKLPPFDARAVARVIEYSSRMARDQHKLSARFGRIADLVREAAYWAEKEGKDIVRAQAVNHAIEEKDYRNNLHEERTHELIQQDTLLIDVKGKTTGQVNALSVLSLGDYTFGQPNRVTASVHPGSDGIVDIEREAELGGPIHTKGVLIISGQLGRRYGHNQPLSLTASLTFEQSYGDIDGDSASAAELCALLSSIANIPLRQDRAMTGSINQRGEIQPIGGVNEKIEGFFTTCKNKGLSGEQGVIIPQANVRNLMLKSEVIEAAEEGNFHIWPITTIDEALALFTDMEIGKLQEDGSYPDGTFNHAVNAKLTQFHEVIKEKEASDKKE